MRLAPLLRVLYREAIMAAVIRYCSRCWTGYATMGDLPAKCGACDRVTRWVESLPLDQPKVPYELNINDKRFLRSIRVASEDGVHEAIE